MALLTAVGIIISDDSERYRVIPPFPRATRSCFKIIRLKLPRRTRQQERLHARGHRHGSSISSAGVVDWCDMKPAGLPRLYTNGYVLQFVEVLRPSVHLILPTAKPRIADFTFLYTISNITPQIFLRFPQNIGMTRPDGARGAPYPLLLDRRHVHCSVPRKQQRLPYTIRSNPASRTYNTDLPRCSSSVIELTARPSILSYAQLPHPQHVSEQAKSFWTGSASS
ncbi:hypothetical protein FA95DRAFT_1046714 [Auriscalpium vulgare]|uniref:Uncharacterized protein n=1 Tax=Auriscalpium vulgare TaxID=40419 RepID=A0ACB8S8K8_9AGAM|nr:hypothetical protein FA95DRAFT_1046714 [Auriscalpium vulgare]